MLQLTKMHGLGNDYLILNCMDTQPEHPAELARRLSDRHFGIGADGLICVKPGENGDFTMEMYNSDGSRGSMCGNGIRCLGKYVYDRGLTNKLCLSIDTDAGRRTLELKLVGKQVALITVDMGTAALSPTLELETEHGVFPAVPVHVGNPHAVIFVPHPETVPLDVLGPVLEQHPKLPYPSNIEFAAIHAPDRLSARVWERGSGITLACGTGACAVFAAAYKASLCKDTVSIRLPGGSLWVEQDTHHHILLTGPAVSVFDAEIAL